MIKYNRNYSAEIEYNGKSIFNFDRSGSNLDELTVNSFGDEWSKFSSFTDEEIKNAGDQYFDIVPEIIYKGKTVLDVGCGTGRWTKYIAPKAGWVDAIDPSDAVKSAAILLKGNKNVRISKVDVSGLPFDDNSFDFVFSLGVLHHIPDTNAAMQSCVSKLKEKGFFLVYLYYNLDNRGGIFRFLFKVSNFFRKIISKFPSRIKRVTCDVIAFFIYMPFIVVSRIVSFIGLKKLVKHIPLSYYRDKSIRIIRNDSLDRFGTPLEQRFSKKQIIRMMNNCGLGNIVVSNNEPFWHVIGQKL